MRKHSGKSRKGDKTALEEGSGESLQRDSAKLRR